MKTTAWIIEMPEGWREGFCQKCDERIKRDCRGQMCPFYYAKARKAVEVSHLDGMAVFAYLAMLANHTGSAPSLFAVEEKKK